MIVAMPEPDDLRQEVTRDVDSFLDRFLFSKLPSYYQPVRDKITLTPLSDYKSLNYNDLRDNYLANIDRIDDIAKNVGISEEDLFTRQYGLLSKSNEVGDAINSIFNDSINRLDGKSALGEMADYESIRYLNGLPLAPAALLASGIGGSLIGLNPMQSLATGIASASAIPIADKIMEYPSLRKYRATMGIRPTAATLTGILTALGFKTLSPQQDQELLDKGMQYVQQQSNQPIQ